MLFLRLAALAVVASTLVAAQKHCLPGQQPCGTTCCATAQNWTCCDFNGGYCAPPDRKCCDSGDNGHTAPKDGSCCGTGSCTSDETCCLETSDSEFDAVCATNGQETCCGEFTTCRLDSGVSQCCTNGDFCKQTVQTCCAGAVAACNLPAGETCCTTPNWLSGSDGCCPSGQYCCSSDDAVDASARLSGDLALEITNVLRGTLPLHRLAHTVHIAEHLDVDDDDVDVPALLTAELRQKMRTLRSLNPTLFFIVRDVLIAHASRRHDERALFAARVHAQAQPFSSFNISRQCADPTTEFCCASQACPTETLCCQRDTTYQLPGCCYGLASKDNDCLSDGTCPGTRRRR